MNKTLPVLALLLSSVIAAPAAAQPPWWGPSRYYPPAPPAVPVPNLAGRWFMNGDPNQPTQIVQPRPDGPALFINEHGSQAPGQIQGDRVWIPSWSDGRRVGLVGFLRGDRIVWPNGTFWSRNPQGPVWPRW